MDAAHGQTNGAPPFVFPIFSRPCDGAFLSRLGRQPLLRCQCGQSLYAAPRPGAGSGLCARIGHKVYRLSGGGLMLLKTSFVFPKLLEELFLPVFVVPVKTFFSFRFFCSAARFFLLAGEHRRPRSLRGRYRFFRHVPTFSPPVWNAPRLNPDSVLHEPRDCSPARRFPEATLPTRSVPVLSLSCLARCVAPSFSDPRASYSKTSQLVAISATVSSLTHAFLTPPFAARFSDAVPKLADHEIAFVQAGALVELKRQAPNVGCSSLLSTILPRKTFLLRLGRPLSQLTRVA